MFDVTCRQEVGAQFQERCPTEASRAYAACLLAKPRASCGAFFSRPPAGGASGDVLEQIRTDSTLQLPLSPAIGVATQPIFLRISQAAEGPPTTRPAARWLPEERPMGGAGSGAHIGQVRPHEAAGSKPCVPRSPGGGAAAHGRGAAVRAGSAQRPAKPEGLLADAPWAIYPSVGLSLAVQQV